MNQSDKDLFEAYEYVDGTLDSLMNLIHHGTPFEVWPKELQAIAWVNPELCGPSKKPIEG